MYWILFYLFESPTFLFFSLLTVDLVHTDWFCLYKTMENINWHFFIDSFVQFRYISGDVRVDLFHRALQQRIQRHDNALFFCFFFRSQLALISKRGIAASRHNTTKVLRYLALLLAIVAYVYISTTSIIVIYIAYICR